MQTPLPITAYSLHTALGFSRADTVEALVSGRSGLLPAPEGLPFATAVGAITAPLAPLPAELAGYDTRLTRIAASLVLALDADLRRVRETWGAHRVAVLLGTSTAGILHSEAAFVDWWSQERLPEWYDFTRQHAYDALLHVVRSLTGIQGPGYIVSTACSSSAKVFGAAARLVAAGVVDAALVGGVDTLCQTTLRGFHSLGVLSAEACRPFSADRDGISIGEGGALLILERKGEGRARFLGMGESSDAHHVSAPHPEGDGAFAAMQGALAAAGLDAAAVDYVNAHGTATPLNDSAEGAAIGRLFGLSPAVASTKGVTGHLLGAAGAVEAVLSILSIEEGIVPASLGATPCDPTIPVRVLSQPSRQRCSTVLSNSFAFGGNNASVVFGASR